MRSNHGVDYTRDHILAKEFASHQARVHEIKQRAHHWRLLDASAEALDRMRHALLEEMALLEEQLTETDKYFAQYIEAGMPIETGETAEKINQLSTQWEQMNTHLQEIDEALLELQLQNSLVEKLGSTQRVQLLDKVIFAGIFLTIALVFIELAFTLPYGLLVFVNVVDTAFCVIFIYDFFQRMYLSEDRWWYVRKHWIDLVSSIPFVYYARFARVVRVFRLLRLLRLRRAVRLLRSASRSFDKLIETFELNLLKRAVYIAIVLLAFGAVSITLLEGTSSNPIRDIWQGLWWSFTTVVTGGFADIYNPTTGLGRFITVGLILLGFTITGIFTASLTSVLVGDDSTRIEQNQHKLESQLEIMDRRLQVLSKEAHAGIISLETVSQHVSNQQSLSGIAKVVCESLMQEFHVQQASVHLFDEETGELVRIEGLGPGWLMPSARIATGDGFMGRLVPAFNREDVADGDLEPETDLDAPTEQMRMACPMVGGRQFIGFLHVVIPDDVGRLYLYNRAPMTLAHHAAIAFYALQLEEKQENRD